VLRAFAICFVTSSVAKSECATGARVDRERLRQIDLHWYDLRRERAFRPLESRELSAVRRRFRLPTLTPTSKVKRDGGLRERCWTNFGN
jgi:hypothetical protein